MIAFATNRFKNGRLSLDLTPVANKTALGDIVDFDGEVQDESYYLDPSNRYYSLIADKMHTPKSVVQLRKYEVRERGDSSVPTLTANMGQGGHNVPFVRDRKGLRKLTEYECLRLQGFPMEFTFPDSVGRAKRYQQIGNAVVPPLISLLGKAIRSKIIEERK
jgi:DNA (cytosine-5)-methyltransferase 1